MASSSRKSLEADLYESKEGPDDVFQMIDDYQPDLKEPMENKLTELNIGISRISEQLEELTRCYKEFVANFVLQQKILREEIQVLRREAQSFRNELQD